MKIGKKLFFALTIFFAALPLSTFAQDSLFGTAVNYEAGLIPQSIFVTDLDGDGDNDLAVANQGTTYPPNTGSVSILLNTGDGIFQAAVNYIGGIYPHLVFACDFDGDGDKDLAVQNNGSENVSIFKNNGDGTFQAQVEYSVGYSDPLSVFASDLDGDGDNDLATANYSTHSVSILENNSDGTFQAAVTYEAGDTPSFIFASELDGNGDNDLATANYNSNNLSILRNNGDGTFQSPTTYYAGSMPSSIFACDLDGDGDNDLAVAKGASNNVSVLKNNGDGTFLVAVSYIVGSGPMSVFAADIDGDEDNDLVTANAATSNISVLINLTIKLSDFHLISPPNNSIINNDEMFWSSSTTLDTGQEISYRVYWDEDNTFISPDSSSELLDTTFIWALALERSQTYYWQVRANGDSAEYRYSAETWSFYFNGYPISPTIINPRTGAFIDSITYLTWLAGTDPDSFDFVSYQIQIDDDSLFGSTEINDTIPPGLILDNSISIRINQLEGYHNLLPDHIYYWRVRSLDNYGLTSGWPDSLHFFTYNHLNHAPNPPVSGFSPANSEEVISLNPTITWNDATDPDPDDNSSTLHYILRLFSDTSTGCGYQYWDTTSNGINQVVIADTMPDNCLWIYMVQTADDEGLASGWSPMQHFWTNHYNYPPEPFRLISPAPLARRVNYYTHFFWNQTVDYDPLSSFTFTLQFSNDSLFQYNTGDYFSGLTDTSLLVPSDMLFNIGAELYWRVLAIDDDSLIRIGGTPEEARRITIVPSGDANGDGSVLGGDVTYLVRYFKGLGTSPDPFLAGDANADCELRGSDVTYLVRYFKGLGPVPVRGNCEQPPACGKQQLPSAEY